jgi:cytoplasmic tRNA 2-thiolation protein 1
VCKECFFAVFETEVHNTIVEGDGVFKRGERVAIGASGGKGELPSAHLAQSACC